MATGNEATLAKWWDDFWSKGDLSVSDDIFDPQFQDHDPNVPGLPPGIEGIKQKNVFYREVMPDLTITVERQLDTGDYAVCHWHAVGTHQGEVFGVKGSGNKIELEGISYFRMRNGRLAEQWIHYDALGMLAQLGVIADPRG